MMFGYLARDCSSVIAGVGCTVRVFKIFALQPWCGAGCRESEIDKLAPRFAEQLGEVVAGSRAGGVSERSEEVCEVRF